MNCLISSHIVLFYELPFLSPYVTVCSWYVGWTKRGNGTNSPLDIGLCYEFASLLDWSETLPSKRGRVGWGCVCGDKKHIKKSVKELDGRA